MKNLLFAIYLLIFSVSSFAGESWAVHAGEGTDWLNGKIPANIKRSASAITAEKASIDKWGRLSSYCIPYGKVLTSALDLEHNGFSPLITLHLIESHYGDLLSRHQYKKIINNAYFTRTGRVTSETRFPMGSRFSNNMINLCYKEAENSKNNWKPLK
jgi:uncharacterized protein (DUF1919 family)